jgi:hypothetical protein
VLFQALIPLKVGVRGNSGVKWSHNTFFTTSGAYSTTRRLLCFIWYSIILSNRMGLLMRALDAGGCYCCVVSLAKESLLKSRGQPCPPRYHQMISSPSLSDESRAPGRVNFCCSGGPVWKDSALDVWGCIPIGFTSHSGTHARVMCGHLSGQINEASCCLVA